MSKHARAIAKQRKRQNKSQSRNAQRKNKYAALAGATTQSGAPSTSSSHKSDGNDEFKKRGMTKAQKKRAKLGKDPKGALMGQQDFLPSNSSGQSSRLSGLWNW